MIDPTLLYLAERSQEAYEASTFAEGGVECLLILENGWRALAFRGTEFDFADILRDIRAAPWAGATRDSSRARAPSGRPSSRQ